MRNTLLNSLVICLQVIPINTLQTDIGSGFIEATESSASHQTSESLQVPVILVDTTETLQFSGVLGGCLIGGAILNFSKTLESISSE